MPPRRRAAAGPAGLTDADVAMLRERVGAGERPRVVVHAASAAVAAGTRGNVVRFGDPKDNEYVVVRLGRDEVPFAPAELGLTGKSASVAAPAPTQKSAPPSKTSAPAKASAARLPAARNTTTRASGAGPRSAKSRKSRRSGPPLVVTLRFREGEWTVEAQRGTRRLARATRLRPGAVAAFADQVDEEIVREALVETVDSCRAVVEERAAALRAELEAAEAALRDYESKPVRRQAR